MAFYFTTVMSVTSLTAAGGYSISAAGRKRDMLFIYNFILQIQFPLTSLLFKKHGVFLDGWYTTMPGGCSETLWTQTKRNKCLSFP